MHELKEIHTEAAKRMGGLVIPSKKLLQDKNDPNFHVNFASFASTIAIESMVGNRAFYFQDTDVAFCLFPTGKSGQEGMDGFKVFCMDLKKLCEKAVEQMKDGEEKTYLLDKIHDFYENGVTMPFYGKII